MVEVTFNAVDHDLCCAHLQHRDPQKYATDRLASMMT
jgi:hypothetical protein